MGLCSNARELLNVRRLVKKPHERALDILRTRDNELSLVSLRCGRSILVRTIAWGYDLGEDVAHITSNVATDPSEELELTLFHANEIVEIVDPDNSAVLFAIDL